MTLQFPDYMYTVCSLVTTCIQLGNIVLLLQLFIIPNGGPTSFLGFFLTMYSTVTNIENILIDKLRVDIHLFNIVK